jgi:tryptophan-rich sensory protein
MSTARSLTGLFVSIVITFGAAWLGSRFTAGLWYEMLVKPSWTPPNAIFGPVWSALYIMMAAAAWLAWKNAGPDGAVLPVVLYVVQLALNAAWSWLFFGRHLIGVALSDILLLLATIIVTAVVFERSSKAAAWLMTPYILWVTFASALNYSIARLNP